MKKLNDFQVDLLQKAARGMCGGTMINWPELFEILQERKLIYVGEETQPVNKFIGEFNKILIEEGE